MRLATQSARRHGGNANAAEEERDCNGATTSYNGPAKTSSSARGWRKTGKDGGP